MINDHINENLLDFPSTALKTLKTPKLTNLFRAGPRSN